MKLEQIKRRNLDNIAKYRKQLYEKPKLRDLFIEVTLKCNAYCEHCGSSCGNDVPDDGMSTDDIKHILDDVASNFKPQDILLNITGGEPLLRSDLFELMAYAVGLGFSWGITTNGILINDRIINLIKETKMASISISLDGLKETHETFRKVPHSFDKIINNIKKLQKIKTIKVVQVTTVANKKNLHELPAMYELMKDLKIDAWRIVNVDSIGRAKDNCDILLDSNDYQYLFDFIEKSRLEKIIKIEYGCAHYLGISLEKELRDTYFMCTTGLSVASLLYNGDIYVCPNVERRPELIQGNIKQDLFSKVWYTKFKEFRNEKRTSCDMCLKCNAWHYCLGDSFHTWNFETNSPNFCIKKIIKEEKDE